jgi:hypothetical protein
MILGGALDEGDGYTGLHKRQFQSNQRWKLTNNCIGCGEPNPTTIPGQYGSPTFAGSITVEEYHNNERQVELGTCYPLDPECSETVLDADGNPVIRGGTSILGKVYNVFNIQNRFDIFPVCGEMEVQDSGNYYYEFERAGIWNQSLDSTNELFFLLLKSVCLDTSISERSQHPHIVGTNSRSSGNFGINGGENRSRQFDNHEEVKKIGLRREISAENIGTITEVFTCEECEYNDDWPHKKTQECVNIITKYRVSNSFESSFFGATYDTLEEALDGLKSLKGIPFFGGDSYWSGMGKADYKNLRSGLLCDSQVLAYGKTTVTPLSFPSDPRPAKPSSSWNRYFYNNPGLPEDLESTLGRRVHFDPTYGYSMGTLRGLNGVIGLNGFNVSTNDDAFDLSSTDAYYPVSGSSLIGIEFYQAHLSYNSDGAAINKEWPLEFTQIYQKQLDFNGETIDIPPMTTTITLK